MQLRSGKVSGDFLTLVTAIGLGALVRLLPVAAGEFPLNDGGLFYRMTEDLIAGGFGMPLMTTYNGGGIPFGYPPLGFYLLGGLHAATGIRILELMRWLPALFSVLTIPAFYLLARRLLQRTDDAALATLVFALIPRSHEWILMGGGIARAPGMLFSILALAQVMRLQDRPTWGRASVLGLLIGLVALSHLEMAWFTAFSLLLLVAFRGRTASVVARVAAALGLGVLLAGTWWIPFLAETRNRPARSGSHVRAAHVDVHCSHTHQLHRRTVPGCVPRVGRPGRNQEPAPGGSPAPHLAGLDRVAGPPSRRHRCFHPDRHVGGHRRNADCSAVADHAGRRS